MPARINVKNQNAHFPARKSRDVRTLLLTLSQAFILLIIACAAFLQVTRDASFTDQNTMRQLKARATYLEDQLDSGAQFALQLEALAESAFPAAATTRCGNVNLVLGDRKNNPTIAPPSEIGKNSTFWPNLSSSCTASAEQLTFFAQRLELLYHAASQIGVSRITVETPIGIITSPAITLSADNSATYSTAMSELTQAVKHEKNQWSSARWSALDGGRVVSFSAGATSRESETAVSINFPVSWLWRFTLPFEGATNEVLVLQRDGQILARGKEPSSSPGNQTESVGAAFRSSMGENAALTNVILNATNRTNVINGYRISLVPMGSKPFLIADFVRSRDFTSYIVARNSVILISVAILSVLTAAFYATIRIVVLRPARAAEIELGRLSSRLQTIFDTTPVGVCLIEDDFRIIATNDRFNDLVKPSASPPGGPRDSNTIGQQCADARIAWLLGDQLDTAKERIVLSNDGRSLLVNSAPLSDGAQRVVTVTDITERMHMQADLASARDAAESASRSKAAFLAAMSHEIRTPMNGVVGMVDLLAQTQLTESQRRNLRTIRDSSYALLRIINDILDFSKIEAGKLEIETLETPLTDIVEGAVAPLAVTATANRLRLLTYVDPTLPRVIRGDPVRIRQILMNLCGNAVKFSKNGQVIVRVDPDPGRTGWVHFSVTDHGIGISEENQKKLFQEFSQAEASTTRRFGGTGLGLAICKRLTEMMNGTIRVNSVLGLGTKFTVELPLPAAEGCANETEPSLEGHSIILVSRSSEERTFARSYLESLSATVFEVDRMDDLFAQIARFRRANRQTPLVIALSDLDSSEVQGAIARIREIAGQTRFVVVHDPADETLRLLTHENTVLVDAQPTTWNGLIDGVSTALGLSGRDNAASTSDRFTRAAPLNIGQSGSLIVLVAEDNPTNREVIEGQLAQLGYACELTENGKEALHAWQTGRFAIVLTDCHMPVMDGFELAGAIRQFELAKQLPPTPIIAITASAMKGEAERCLAAGMNDYVAKPVELEHLRDCMNRWLSLGQNKTLESRSSASSPGVNNDVTLPVLDLSQLRETFADNESKITSVLARFLEVAQQILDQMKTASENPSLGPLGELSHKLKSSSLTVGADALADSCRRLEEACNFSDREPIVPLCERLRTEFDRVSSEIRQKLISAA